VEEWEVQAPILFVDMVTTINGDVEDSDAVGQLICGCLINYIYWFCWDYRVARNADREYDKNRRSSFPASAKLIKLWTPYRDAQPISESCCHRFALSLPINRRIAGFMLKLLLITIIGCGSLRIGRKLFRSWIECLRVAQAKVTGSRVEVGKAKVWRGEEKDRRHWMDLNASPTGNG
jgi:hypothetical protein